MCVCGGGGDSRIGQYSLFIVSAMHKVRDSHDFTTLDNLELTLNAVTNVYPDDAYSCMENILVGPSVHDIQHEKVEAITWNSASDLSD